MDRTVPGRLVAFWLAFAAVHAWLTFLGVVVVPSEAFYDVDLYRWWMHLALEQGRWPVLDEPFVYPVGAVLPMLVPTLAGTASTPVYALGWCAMVTALDAAAAVALTRAAYGDPTARHRPAPAGAWWWLAFLVLLGPVAVGRLDAVIAPLMLVALALAVRSRRATAAVVALLTVGAWIKVAPGALLLPLVARARRPLREVVLPAAAVCAAVAGVVALGGGAGRLVGFLTTQGGRGLQVESVTATPWVLASTVRDDVVIRLNEELITYEVTGPGTTAAAAALDVVLVTLVVTVGAALLIARRRGTASAALLPGALTVLLALVVANKVGSPQFLTWVAPPLAVLLTVGSAGGRSGSRVRPPWLTVAAGLALGAAGLTQVVFPWGYLRLLTGDPSVAGALAVRNGLLVALLVCAAVGLVRAVRGRADQPSRGTTS